MKTLLISIMSERGYDFPSPECSYSSSIVTFFMT